MRLFVHAPHCRTRRVALQAAERGFAVVATRDAHVGSHTLGLALCPRAHAVAHRAKHHAAGGAIEVDPIEPLRDASQW